MKFALQIVFDVISSNSLALILIVNCPCSVTNIIVIPCIYIEHYRYTMLRLLSLTKWFSSKLQSFMTILHNIKC